jgi:hypothetical protein
MDAKRRLPKVIVRSLATGTAAIGIAALITATSAQAATTLPSSHQSAISSTCSWWDF